MEPGTAPRESGTLETSQRPRRMRIGLSGKLLFLTIVFVMVAEVLIYVPSIVNFRLNWLNDRLAAAHTAALVLDATHPCARQIWREEVDGYTFPEFR